MAIAVIGGAGFVGSHLVDELLAQQFELVVVDDLSTGRLENIARWKGHPKLEFVRTDASDPAVMRRVLDHKNWVFNFAPVSVPELADQCALAGARRLVDNTGGGVGCELREEQQLPVVSFDLQSVYGPRGPTVGSVFVSDIVRVNMMAAMNHEIVGLVDLNKTIYWRPQITPEQGAEIIELYEKNARSSLIIVSR